MLVPVKWLKKYLDLDADVAEIAKRVTDSGSHVESINTYENLSNLVIAKITDIRKHENAEKLSLVDIDYKTGKETVVTGAKNMKIGDNVVFAKLGAKLPGNITIGEAEFKGVKSSGMLCSYQELGVKSNLVPKNSEEGIIILGDDVNIGDDAIKVLDLDDYIIEFEITPNRPDCLSIIGMAREVAAVFDTKLKEPSIEIKNQEDDYKEYFNGVEVSTDKVNRFMTAIVKNVEIKESPIYIQNYLRNAGMRPINNIVDFTNFIMLEYGQPLHAYDLDKIEGKKLIVRNGRENTLSGTSTQMGTSEKIKTLDQSEREILVDDIVIADGNSKAIGLAGVMGGFETEVTNNTKNILIESASFDAEAIRKISKRLGLRSEASSRYEKIVPAKLAEYGIKRFLKLVEETNSGIIVKGIDDIYTNKLENKKIKLRNQRSNSLLGINLTVEESAKYLESLEINTKIENDEIIADIPYFRTDLNIEVDLIEEIGRLYGFHNIKAKSLVGELTQGVKSELRNFTDRVKEYIFAQGFSEIVTYSFISRKQYDKLNLKENNPLRNSVEILNPLGEDFSVMRTTLIGNMLDVIRKNLNNKQDNLRFSEIGNSFKKYENSQSATGTQLGTSTLSGTSTIKEEKLLAYSLVGEYDYYYLKDSLEKLLFELGIRNIVFKRKEENEIFHPGRSADVYIENKKIGSLGEIHPIVLDNFDIEKRVYLAEINLDILLEYSKEIVKYEKISKYPLVERDIAFVIDKNIESQEIINTIKENGGQYIKFVKLFDIYSGEQIGEGKVSLAYKIGFQSNDFTLKDNIVKEAFENIVKALTDKFNIDLRS